MIDWKEQLINKSKELNLKGGKDGQGISYNTIPSRTSNRISADVHRVSIHTEKIINIKKEEKVMITKEAAIEDLEKIDVNGPVGKVIVEVGRILIKVLATIRSNQLLCEVDKLRINEARAKRDAKKEPQQ